MAYSVNTTPLLLECDSDADTEETGIDNDVVRRDKLLCKPLEPRDKYNLAYFIFYLLGIVTLLPWNFFITADDYWLYKFRDVNSSGITSEDHRVAKRTPLQASFTSYISVASAVPSLLFLIINTALSHKISLHVRVFGSLSCMLVLFLSTLAFVLVDTDKWQQQFFIITLITIVLLNVCSAVLSGSIFGVMGRFSPVYITATIGGQALGGIFAAVAELVSLAVGASSMHSALVYFCIGNAAIFAAVVSYAVLTRTVFFRYHVGDGGDVGDPLRLEMEGSRGRGAVVCHRAVLRKLWPHAVAMLALFAVTLSVYPAVTVLVESEGKGHGNPWNDVYFVPTIAYLLFSIGDYLGRIIAGKVMKPKKAGVLIILSLSRFIFIPLMMLCNAQPRQHWAVVFDRDYQYIIILFLCALSNGYLANIFSICAPRLVEPHEKETASSIMAVFMGVGLALGSSISLLMVKLL